MLKQKLYTWKKLWFNMLWLHAVNHTQAYIITFKIQPCHQKWVSFFFWPQIKLPIHKQIWDRVDKNQAFYFHDYLLTWVYWVILFKPKKSMVLGNFCILHFKIKSILMFAVRAALTNWFLFLWYSQNMITN